MERLTKRDKNGKAIPAKTSAATYVGTIYEENKVLEQERLDRLAEYEDKRESGLLVELPCKVGDIFYWAYEGFGNYRIEEEKVKSISVEADGIKVYVVDGGYFWEDSFGECCFTDKAQAEAKLKELQSK